MRSTTTGISRAESDRSRCMRPVLQQGQAITSTPVCLRRRALANLVVVSGGDDVDETSLKPEGAACSTDVTFASYAGRFLAGFARANSKGSELRHKEWAFRMHLIPLLGERRLSELTKSDGGWLKVKLRARRLASKSCNNTLTIAKTMLYLAVDDGLFARNPWARVRKHKVQKRGGWDYWTREESEPFLRRVSVEAPKLYPIFLTLLRTGMRIGEVAGLFVDDIDFQREEIAVLRRYRRALRARRHPDDPALRAYHGRSAPAHRAPAR